VSLSIAWLGGTVVARQYAPDAAFRIRHITRVARYQVHMNMHARLASRFSNIHSNVKSKKSATWRFGMTRTCPRPSELLS
jgi:hypothetical protein